MRFNPALKNERRRVCAWSKRVVMPDTNTPSNERSEVSFPSSFRVKDGEASELCF
jgi:hypothetical protein